MIIKETAMRINEHSSRRICSIVHLHAPTTLGKQFLGELGVILPTSILSEDNQACIAIATRNGSKRAKHIDIKHHFVRDEIRRGTAIVQYVDSNNQLADIFTKALTVVQQNKKVNRIMQ